MLRQRRPDALQGTLDLLVLQTFSLGPQHGYGIAAHVQRASDEILRMEEGALYPALHRMEQAGWIAAAWEITGNNRRARVYRLTPAGQKRLREEQAKWDRLTDGVGRVLRFV